MSDETPTEVHKPKPRRDWRSFGKEYVIVVLGVATALAAQQAADWLHWQGEVAEARSIIATELAGNVRLAIFRMRSAQCVEHRLGELAVILDGATKSGTLPPVGDIDMPSRGLWASGSWESVVASQTATHFPRQELAALTVAYRQVALLADVPEGSAWSSLYAMVGPGRRLDPASDARLRDALGHARAANRAMAQLSRGLINSVKTLNLPFSPEDLKVIALGDTSPLANPPRDWLDKGPGFGAICAPIGAVPAAYGQAMWSAVPTLWDDALKAKPRFTAGPQ